MLLAYLDVDVRLFTLFRLLASLNFAFRLLASLNYTLQTPNRSPEPSDFS